MNGRSIDGEATDDPDNVVREIKQNGNASRRELRREGLKKRKRRKMVTPEFSHGRCRAPEPSFKSLTRSPRTFFCEGVFFMFFVSERLFLLTKRFGVELFPPRPSTNCFREAAAARGSLKQKRKNCLAPF